jgi:hypothetical protein
MPLSENAHQRALADAEGDGARDHVACCGDPDATPTPDGMVESGGTAYARPDLYPEAAPDQLAAIALAWARGWCDDHARMLAGAKEGT